MCKCDEVGRCGRCDGGKTVMWDGSDGAGGRWRDCRRVGDKSEMSKAGTLASQDYLVVVSNMDSGGGECDFASGIT